jgi:hypothetical protein
MLQSFHQNSEQFEIMFNKTKFDALPAKIRSIIENGVEAASQDLFWKAIDRYSADYIELQKMGVKFYKTPDAILNSQLTAYDAAAAKKGEGNAMFKEIEASQKKFAERVVKWDLDNNVSRRMAYNHYFGQKAAAPPRRRRRKDRASAWGHHPGQPGWCFFENRKEEPCRKRSSSSTGSAPSWARRSRGSS